MRGLLFSALMITVCAALCTAEEALLREAWALGPGQKAALLAEARERVDDLTGRVPAEPGLRTGLAQDLSVTWLLSHREAAYLAVDERLPNAPPGAERTVLLYLAARLGHRTLGCYLPGLLENCQTDGQQLEVLECMCALRDASSLKAMADLVEHASVPCNEGLIIAATRGLGLSRRKEYLPVVRKAGGLVASPRGRFEAARAAYACGDKEAAAEVARCLSPPDADRTVRKDVIQFLCLNPEGQGVEALAQFALTTKDEELAAAAVRAMVQGTDYGGPGELMPEERGGQPGTGPGQPASGGAQDWQDKAWAPRGAEGRPAVETLPREQRDELAQTILEWWRKEGRRAAEERAAQRPPS